jgi:FAD/FMN-containing dehydrogenase
LIYGPKVLIRHMAWAGAANIDGGVTIDLSAMKGLRVSPDKSLVSVEPGNRWWDVYSRIEPLGIAVSGGRWGNVGVGGLLTGGITNLPFIKLIR